MEWTSIIAIYGLFWVFCAFLLLPFGIRTHSDDETVERIPGQAESAPLNFRPKVLLVRATALAAVLFGLYYANYVNGWVEVQDLNVFGHPPEYEDET